MRSIVKTGKTVKEAVEEALNELQLEEDDVSIEVLNEPSKGFLGLIGAKDAKVKVTVTNDPVEMANNFLEILFAKMEIKADFQITRKDKDLNIEIENVDERDKGIIIGKRGKTLDALQYLVSLVVNKDREKYVRIILDIENYRHKREQTLIRLAKKMAAKSKALNKKIKLEPMNPYERRIIHSALQNDPNILTHSEGEEPFRRVVIERK
ncbi:RNA-binding cell elongation regulator Jag/EloR [Caldisalinibacter kiritimatiensis]|uniref:RNA-binding protein KhpB n=1 Tax=Caldisalinibacter kiritimatiensis TaxID=1304284 RepID=R1CRU9_9FIRM|nr:RNA-binding cell elongation regulator Jag/EloR [Caldisalinibacter kiritimatiensis]EOC99428.1 RNA-binding protein Jag [Caldisalinibacter kiritimatiensis]